jgi:hypothetical protein
MKFKSLVEHVTAMKTFVNFIFSHMSWAATSIGDVVLRTYSCHLLAILTVLDLPREGLFFIFLRTDVVVVLHSATFSTDPSAFTILD